MQRKVIQQSPTSLGISLPKKWTDSINIRKGDEIVVEINNNLLTLIPKNIKQIPKEIHLKLNINENNMRYTIINLYRLGYEKRWSYFIRKVYETDPLTCPKCHGEMRIISFIDQPDVIKTILQHLGLWEESQPPPGRDPPIKKITFDPSYSQVI